MKTSIVSFLVASVALVGAIPQAATKDDPVSVCQGKQINDKCFFKATFHWADYLTGRPVTRNCAAWSYCSSRSGKLYDIECQEPTTGCHDTFDD